MTNKDIGYGELLYDITKAQMRWRMAFRAIYAVRVLLSLPKKILSRTNSFKLSTSEILLSNPYTPINGEPKSNKTFDVDTIGLDLKGLATLVKDKNLVTLSGFGGVEGITNTLGADLENGIPDDARGFAKRREVFGSNTYQKPPPKGLLYFVIDALKDITILILMVCAALALGFGIKEHGGKEGWYEGGSIFIAVVLVVVGSALSNFRQETQFDKLSKIRDNIKIDMMRGGRRQEISIFDIVVGDVVLLNIGNQIPADGLFLNGHSLLVDESSMTGESDLVEIDLIKNPFLISGSKVADGYGKMLVTSVGLNTEWGLLMSSISRDTDETTPLQARIDKLTASIGKVGLTVASLVLIVLLIRYFTGNTKDENGKKEYNGSRTDVNDVLNAVVKIVAAAVTIVVVAIPEGLRLAVNLTLAYSMKRMMADKAMVRKLSACETMGSATIICTDIAGTLTMNQMKVTKFCLGQEQIDEDSSSSPTSTNGIAASVRELFYQAVGLNTTGSVCKSVSGSELEISGSTTEKAILSWAVLNLGMEVERLKRSYAILHVETFNSEEKRSGVLLRKKEDNSIHVHWKGAAEMVVAMCSSYYESNGIVKSLDQVVRNKIEKIIEGMAASSLRCIAFAHGQISEKDLEYEDKTHHMLKKDDLTLLGIVGLKDPCRPGVKDVVAVCKSAGVAIKMITGDNVFTAKAIAVECGILGGADQATDGEVVEGSVFRNYTEEERMKKIDTIRVMARSSPSDKLLMVQCLKKAGDVVAVTGDGTNDAPALKEADIGLSMGIRGTEVAKESSDIIILDDNFTSVATVLRWGRCVYNNIQKIIQFQLTVIVAALVINIVAAFSTRDIPLTAVQLLWVSLVMELGAQALATECPSNELMERVPVGRTEPLITNIMWRNLLAQSLYQKVILVALLFKGEEVLKVSKDINNTMLFNTFVLCQVFNEFNARSMGKKHMFKGIHKNKLFMGLIGFTIVLQVGMVEFLKKFAGTEKLNWWQWLACIVTAAVTWPIGWLVKSIPVEEPYIDYFMTNIFTSPPLDSIAH